MRGWSARRESNSAGTLIRRPGSTGAACGGWAICESNAAQAPYQEAQGNRPVMTRSANGRIRTVNARGLSPSPLPIGLRWQLPVRTEGFVATDDGIAGGRAARARRSRESYPHDAGFEAAASADWATFAVGTGREDRTLLSLFVRQEPSPDDEPRMGLGGETRTRNLSVPNRALSPD